RERHARSGCLREPRPEAAAPRPEPQDFPLRRAHERSALRAIEALAGAFDAPARQQVVYGQLVGLLRRLADGLAAVVRLARLVEALLGGARVAGGGELLAELVEQHHRFVERAHTVPQLLLEHFGSALQQRARAQGMAGVATEAHDLAFTQHREHAAAFG